MVVIADADGPTSLAGVMGGERSEVHPGTTRVLLEVAVWDGPNVNRTSQRLGLRSEASSRFEKGLSPERLQAQAVATRLIAELLGARLVDGTVDVGGPGPRPAVIRLRDAHVERLLGLAIPRERRPRSWPRSSSACRTPRTASTSPSPPSAATTSTARPTSSRRSRGSAASTSSLRRCPTAAGCRAA